MSVLKYQSDDELVRVMDEWVRNFFPPNVVKNERNVTLIGDRCVQKYGLVSISGLTEAAHELGAAHLDLVLQPKELTPAEKAAAAAKKAEERMQRDYMDSIKPQESFDEKVKRDAAKRQAEEWVRGQEKARGQLGAAILDYKCYKLNHTDITGSETVQRDLKTIRVPAHDGKGVDGKNTDYHRDVVLGSRSDSRTSRSPEGGRRSSGCPACKREVRTASGQTERQKSRLVITGIGTGRPKLGGSPHSAGRTTASAACPVLSSPVGNGTADVIRLEPGVRPRGTRKEKHSAITPIPANSLLTS